jgi:hypothetical protein
MAQVAVPFFVKGLTLEGGDALVAEDNVRNPLLASLYTGALVLALAVAGLFGPRAADARLPGRDGRARRLHRVRDATPVPGRLRIPAAAA